MTPAPDESGLLAQLERDGQLLLAAYQAGGSDALVPGLTWDARAVLVHTGAVHRWAADIVARALPTNEIGGSAAFSTDMADDGLAGWFRDGLSALVDTLRAAPPELACFTFIRGIAPRTFWIRRQAHETAIHRVDVEAAARRPITPFDAGFAQDGLAELVGGFATQRGFATDRAGRLLLRATDGASWLVTFGGERNVVEHGELIGAAADAVVQGTSDELYRWAWNRPVDISEDGDSDVIASWRAVQIV